MTISAMQDLFQYAPMKALVSHLCTWNTATQALAASAADEPDLSATGTALAFIAGEPVTVAAPAAAIDLSDEDVCDVAGETYTSETVWLLVITDGSDDGYLVKYAGTGTTPTIPEFDADTYVAIGLVKIVAGAGGVIIGTTAWNDADAVETFIQIIGPCIPNYANV